MGDTGSFDDARPICFPSHKAPLLGCGVLAMTFFSSFEKSCFSTCEDLLYGPTKSKAQYLGPLAEQPKPEVHLPINPGLDLVISI